MSRSFHSQDSRGALRFTDPTGNEPDLLKGTHDDGHERSEDTSRVKNPSWLANDICRRVNVSPLLPKFYVAKAGTLSANYFTETLLDDSSNINGGFLSFMDSVKSRIVDKLSNCAAK